MGEFAATLNRDADEIVALSLNGGRVTRAFREALFDAAGREGITVNELVLQRAAERLRDRGAKFSGVFTAGDINLPEAEPCKKATKK